MNRNCMACKIAPPAVKFKVVKNLNMSYCKVNSKDTNDDALHNNKKGKKMAMDKGAKPPKNA